MSVAVWVAVLWALWVERQYGVKVLGAFVLPVVLVFGINSTTTRPLAIPGIERALGGAWIWVHIGLVLLGIAAFVLNFAGALMYVLQERQLKAKRPGKLYYRLPDLETLDRLTYRTLALGFPFLTTGLILGVLWAGRAWGSVFAYDRSARAPVVRRLGDLRGDARGACGRGLARAARGVLRDHRVRHAGAHAERGLVPAGKARLPDGAPGEGLNGAVRRGALAPERAPRAARAARRGRGQAPRDPEIGRAS